MADTSTDAALIEASRRDPAMFAGIFDRHAARIATFLSRRVGRGDAEDLLGEVFRIAFERRGFYDVDRVDAAPWLYGIAQNLLRQSHRRSAAQRNLELRLAADPDLRSEQPLEPSGSQDLEAVVLALHRLPEADRDPLLMWALDGLTYAQIAEAMDIPVGTVRSRIARARQRLRDLVPGLDDESRSERSPR